MNDSMNQFMNNDYKSLSDYLFSFTGNEFAIISAIVGFVISQNLSIDEVNSLGNFLFLCSMKCISSIYKQKYSRKVHDHMGAAPAYIGRGIFWMARLS